MTQSIYVDDSITTRQVIISVAAAFGVSVAATFLTIFVYRGLRFTYRKRRTPLARIAIKVINAASREIEPRVHAMGIGSRNGELVIRIPTTHLDQFSVGDQLLAYQAHTSEQLGAVLMIEVDSDSCLCSVSDKMYNDRFWSDLEDRMQFNFQAPHGVEFSHYVDQYSIALVRKLVRSWEG